MLVMSEGHDMGIGGVKDRGDQAIIELYKHEVQ